MPFEIYREQYVSPARLGFDHGRDAGAAVSQRAACERPLQVGKRLPALARMAHRGRACGG